MQVQTYSLSKTDTKIVIALNGNTNGNGGLFAVQGNGGSSDLRTLRVAGTIALTRGWKVSVKVFTKDRSWIAKRSSGFSCHLLKMFDGCLNEGPDQIQAQMLALIHETNSTILDGTNILISSRGGLVSNETSSAFASAAPSVVPYNPTCALVGLVFTILSHHIQNDFP